MNEKYDIFISYSRSDLKKVKAIKAELERTTHAKCWMDLEGIESGSPQFDEVIVKGIAQSKVFLFMLSSNSQKSEFALNELELARRKARADNGNKKVVLVNIDDCEMTDTFYLRYNRMDIIEWNNDPQRNKLFRDIAKWTNITSEDTKPLTEEGKKEEAIVEEKKQESRTEKNEEATKLDKPINVVNEEIVIEPKEKEEMFVDNSLEDENSQFTPLQFSVIKYSSIAFIIFLSIHCFYNLTSIFDEEEYNMNIYSIHNHVFGFILIHSLAILVLVHLFYALKLAYKGLIPRLNLVILCSIILLGILHLYNFWYNMAFSELVGSYQQLDPADGFAWILETFSNPMFVLLHIIWLAAIWLYLCKGFWAIVQIIDKEKRICNDKRKTYYIAYVTLLILCNIAIVISFAFHIAPSLN